ncbi:unnamed protein product [Spirodela intermedia]|uniref:Uncharacterized protein n=1 Tax=Spirodela intermedia TaxID=51605 RepID=A0A7I8JUY2_SPIIN|nr:unnamed protein product [Spirodela intermedia]CAA6673262.1 unnamed protein product [Spirodela intermedia]
METLCGAVALLLLVSGCESATTAAAGGEEGTWRMVPGRSTQPLSEMRGGFLYTRGRGRCTPQFWSAREEAWPMMVPQEASVWKVFGSPALERYEPQLTVLEAMESNDDIDGSAFSQLVKQSSAALLNSYTREGFPYTPWEIKTLLLQALVSEEAATSQARCFADVNHACS